MYAQHHRKWHRPEMGLNPRLEVRLSTDVRLLRDLTEVPKIPSTCVRADVGAGCRRRI
jgi:hypothetical protein